MAVDGRQGLSSLHCIVVSLFPNVWINVATIILLLLYCAKCCCCCCCCCCSCCCCCCCCCCGTPGHLGLFMLAICVNECCRYCYEEESMPRVSRRRSGRRPRFRIKSNSQQTTRNSNKPANNNSNKPEFQTTNNQQQTKANNKQQRQTTNNNNKQHKQQ